MDTGGGPVMSTEDKLALCLLKQRSSTSSRQTDRLRAGIDIERMYQAGQEITLDVVGCKFLLFYLFSKVNTKSVKNALATERN